MEWMRGRPMFPIPLPMIILLYNCHKMISLISVLLRKLCSGPVVVHALIALIRLLICVFLIFPSADGCPITCYNDKHDCMSTSFCTVGRFFCRLQIL